MIKLQSRLDLVRADPQRGDIQDNDNEAIRRLAAEAIE